MTLYCKIRRSDNSLRKDCIPDCTLCLSSTELLEDKKNEETKASLFTEMPNKHYMIVTQLLLQQWVLKQHLWALTIYGPVFINYKMLTCEVHKRKVK